MLSDLQDTLRPYLGYFGDHSWIQALVTVVVCFIVAWIFNRFVITLLKYLTGKTKIDFDNRLIDLLHGPVYISFILLGFALATKILGIGESFELVVF
jgi:hypothetical protein